MAVTNNSEILRAVNAYYARRMSRQALSFVVKSYSGTAFRSDAATMSQSTFAEVIDFVNEGLDKVYAGRDRPRMTVEVDSFTESIRITPVGSAEPAPAKSTTKLRLS